MSGYMLGGPGGHEPPDRRVYDVSPERFGTHTIFSVVFDGKKHVILDDIVDALGSETFYQRELMTVAAICPKVPVRSPGGVREAVILDQDRLNLVVLTSSSNEGLKLKVWAASLLTRAQRAGETFETAVPSGSSLSPFAAIRAMCDQMEAMSARVDRAEAKADGAMMIARNDDGFYSISSYLSLFRSGVHLSADQTKEMGGWLSNVLRRLGRLAETDRRKVFNPQDLDEHNQPLPGKYGANRYSRKALDELLWPELRRCGLAK